MGCKLCEKNQMPEGVPQVLEIVNPEKPVLFHKVIFPASLGDDETYPPESLNYRNVLLQYEANSHVYLYSSDGAATLLPTGATDLTKVKEELAQHGIDIENLQTSVANLQTDLATETTAREQADTNLQSQINTNKQGITTLNTTVATHTQQINTLETNLTDVSTELQGDIANEALARSEADNTLQTNIDAISSNLNQEVEKETDFTTDSSTVTVQHTKVNLSNNDTNITTDPLPVASETQAGVMNTATYQAIQNNAENVDAILNGAIALEGISATPTQEELTTAWKTATGKTQLINRASIYDIDNDKVWYYYENISEWKALTAGDVEMDISTFTNSTAGIIKGSENDGQVFAEADGTGSVVGWDGVKHDIENITELLDTNPIPKLYDAYSTNTDGANTAEFINTKLNTNTIALGNYAAATGNAVAIGGGLSSTNRTTAAGTSVAVGYRAHATFPNSVALGAYSTVNNAGSIALGESSITTRNYEVSLGGKSSNPTRFLANVTAGTKDTDAVNVSQLNASKNRAWQANTAYAEGELVVNDGTLYTVTTDFTSGEEFDDTNLEALGGGSGVQLYSGYSNATDGANTAAFINGKLNGTILMLGNGAKNTSSFGTVENAVILGKNAVGTNMSSNVSGNVVIGASATGGNSRSTAIGEGARANGKESVAIGGMVAGSTNYYTTASTDSVAVGGGAMATSTDSVALGYRSTTSRTGEVSIGKQASVGSFYRYLANVRAGELDTDAVNLKQMQDYALSEDDIMTPEEFEAAWEAA